MMKYYEKKIKKKIVPLLKPGGPSPATKTNPDKIESALMLPLALGKMKMEIMHRKKDLMEQIVFEETAL